MTLTLEQVSVSYGEARIIDNVSLSVADGEFLSLIGPNGAGKTTLLNAISGALPLSSGRILFHSQDISQWKADRRSRFGIGRSFQATHLFPKLSVLENVLLAVQAKHGTKLRTAFSKPRSQLTEEARHYLSEVELTGEAVKPAGLLSHGDKRKLEIAMLLALEPKLLLLDEPTAGMAITEVPTMLSLLESFKAQGQFSVILVEHKLDVVMRLSDRVMVLQQGAVLADGSPADVVNDPDVQTAYLGGAHGTRT